MKNLTFDIHRYAPELNRVFVRGVEITQHIPANVLRRLSTLAAYSQLVKTVRKAFAPATFTRWARVTSTRDAEKFADLNKDIGGGYRNARDVLMIIRRWGEVTRGGKLLNGDTLPPSTLRVRFRPHGKIYDVTHLRPAA